MLKRLMAINTKGDTIVEIMVVLAILGLAISISYATANASISDSRQAYEASTAAVVVQSQVEALRALTGYQASDPSHYIFGSTLPFCISGGSIVYLPSTSCTIGIYTPSNPYNVTIVGPGGGTGGTFTITATWQDVEGQGTDSDQIVYRLYPT